MPLTTDVEALNLFWKPSTLERCLCKEPPWAKPWMCLERVR